MYSGRRLRRQFVRVGIQPQAFDWNLYAVRRAVCTFSYIRVMRGLCNLARHSSCRHGYTSAVKPLYLHETTWDRAPQALSPEPYCGVLATNV
jgi:hypothetical protein